MKKIEVKICTGTLCYVMGGADLQVIDEHLPEGLLEMTEIKGAPCLELRRLTIRVREQPPPTVPPLSLKPWVINLSGAYYLANKNTNPIHNTWMLTIGVGLDKIVFKK